MKIKIFTSLSKWVFSPSKSLSSSNEIEIRGMTWKCKGGGLDFREKGDFLLIWQYSVCSLNPKVNWNRKRKQQIFLSKGDIHLHIPMYILFCQWTEAIKLDVQS